MCFFTAAARPIALPLFTASAEEQASVAEVVATERVAVSPSGIVIWEPNQSTRYRNSAVRGHTAADDLIGDTAVSRKPSRVTSDTVTTKLRAKDEQSGEHDSRANAFILFCGRDTFVRGWWNGKHESQRQALEDIAQRCRGMPPSSCQMQ